MKISNCNAQVKNSESLLKAIEEIKNVYRNIGLEKIDKIEGIYFFNVEENNSGFQGRDSYLNYKKSYNEYIAIMRTSIENIYYLFVYAELSGDPSESKFYLQNTNWYIKKQGNSYIVTCDDNENSIRYNSEVIFSGFNISFEEKSSIKSLPGTFHTTFLSIKKIYPTTTEENIYKTGTGFLISENGYLITNYHVIENSDKVYVSCQNYKRIKADIIATDENNDIALLKINASFKTIPYKITPTHIEIGSNVFTLGYPLIESMGQEVKLTNGIINSDSGYENDKRYYQFSAEIQPGNSGGPLFDSDGNIVGLVSAKHNQATNAGYALKSIYLNVFIGVMEPTIKQDNLNSIKSLSLSEKYKIVKDYIVLLEIE